MLDMQKKLSNSFYAVLSLPATAMGFALSIQIAALSWIMSFKYGLKLEEVGFVWAAGPLAGIFGQVIIGLISDKVWFWGGRRRPFVLVGGALAALMLLALPNIDKIHDMLGFGELIWVALFVALTLDLAINISFNPTRSIIADVTPDGDKRTKGYTWMQTISGTFGMMAYAIGAYYDNFILIYAGSVIVLLFSIIPMFFIEEKKDVEVVEDAELNEEVKVHHKTEWGQLIRIYIAHGFSWIGIQTMFVFIFAFIKQFMFGNDAVLAEDQQVSIGAVISISFLILNGVGAILPATVLEPVSKIIGRVKTHMIAVAIMALGYWGVVAFVADKYMLWGMMAVCGIGWAAVVSLPFAIMSEKVDKKRMGFFMGIFNLSVVIPQLLVSWGIGQYIGAQKDMTIVFIISAVSLTISAICWLFVKEKPAEVSVEQAGSVSGGMH